jgi:hypothetical protein
MELLILAGQLFDDGEGATFASVPFLFIEDKEGSTMSSTEEVNSMMRYRNYPLYEEVQCE